LIEKEIYPAPIIVRPITTSASGQPRPTEKYSKVIFRM
jgi:hypothetical protein